MDVNENQGLYDVNASEEYSIVDMELESESEYNSGCVKNSGNYKGLPLFRLLGEQQPFSDKKKAMTQNNSNILVMFNDTCH